MNDSFKARILQGIPTELPPKKTYPKSANSAPKRKDMLSLEEKRLAVRNALRYFPHAWHAELSIEFAEELKTLGRIYMHRFKPDYPPCTRARRGAPSRSAHGASIMLRIQSSSEPPGAPPPEELTTCGGNGAGFKSWAQSLLTMQYWATMSEAQT